MIEMSALFNGFSLLMSVKSQNIFLNTHSPSHLMDSFDDENCAYISIHSLKLDTLGKVIKILHSGPFNIIKIQNFLQPW